MLPVSIRRTTVSLIPSFDASAACVQPSFRRSLKKACGPHRASSRNSDQSGLTWVQPHQGLKVWWHHSILVIAPIIHCSLRGDPLLDGAERHQERGSHLQTYARGQNGSVAEAQAKTAVPEQASTTGQPVASSRSVCTNVVIGFVLCRSRRATGLKRSPEQRDIVAGDGDGPACSDTAVHNQVVSRHHA